MLKRRVLSALVGIPLLVAVVCAGGWWLTATTAALAILGLREFWQGVRNPK